MLSHRCAFDEVEELVGALRSRILKVDLRVHRILLFLQFGAHPKVVLVIVTVGAAACGGVLTMILLFKAAVVLRDRLDHIG